MNESGKYNYVMVVFKTKLETLKFVGHKQKLKNQIQNVHN